MNIRNDSILLLATAALISCASESTDLCAEETCGGQGVCAVANDEPLCVCNEGFVADGLSCISDTDPCDGETCSDNGTCAVSDDQVVCICDEGFVADDLSCVAVVNLCDGETCSGNGICSVGEQSGTAFCACVPGFVDQGLECVSVPQIAVLSPVFGATDVDIDSTIEITFSKSMTLSSLQNGLSVIGPLGEVSGQIAVTGNGTIATFTPDEPLTEFESQYAVTLTSTVKDTDGVSIEPFAWNFSTVVVDESYFYRLQTQSNGPTQSLDTFAGTFGCFQADTSTNTTGQFWHFQSFGSDGQFVLSNSFQPTKLLEGGGPDGGNCRLTDPSAPAPNLVPFTGQRWRLLPVVGHPTDCTSGPFPYYFLQNQFLGEEQALDSTGMDATTCSAGQFWRPVREGLVP